MRSSAISSNDFMNLYSGSNYSSPANRFSSTFTKGFGKNFNSPKSEPEKQFSFATKLRNDNPSSSSRYSPKAEKAFDTSDTRSTRTREYSTPKSQQGFSSSASGFFPSSERSQAEKRTSMEPSKNTKTYNQTSSYRPPSASSMTKSTMFREATREDSNILTRKKYDIDTNSTINSRVANESRAYSTKHNESKDKYDDYSPKKDTASYYPLDEFLSKYSISKTPNTESTQKLRFNTEKTESAYSMTMSKVINEAQNNQSSNALRSSSYLANSEKSPYSSSPRYNSYFERHGGKQETPKESNSKYANKVPSFEYKRLDYSKDNSDYNLSNDKPVLTRSELNFKKALNTKERENTENDSDYNKSSYRGATETKEKYKPYMTQPAQNGDTGKPSLDSFITKVERGVPTQPFRKFEDKLESKTYYNDSPLRTPKDSRDSPAKQSQSGHGTEEKSYRSASKTPYDDEDEGNTYSGELKKWSSKYTRSPSTRNDESTDSGLDEDSPVKVPSSTYYVSNLKKYLSRSDSNDYFAQIYREHFQQSFQSMKLCRYMTPTDARNLAKKKVYLSKKDCYKNKKTLVFDLDETLIHCNDSTLKRSDVKLPIRFPGGEVIEAGINIRPYAVEILKELSKDFELIVFTASHKCYADVVLNYLDPQKQYIQHRLYRDSCIYTEEGVYVKDLRVFANRDLKDLVLIDNAAYSYGFQLENGIPIIPYYENKSDQELKLLIPYLKRLATAKDVREVNKQTFNFHKYSQYNSSNEVFQSVIC